MRKYFIVSLLSAFLFSLSLVFMGSNEVQAATVGQQLSQPEEGWKRYDGNTSLLHFTEQAGTYSGLLGKHYNSTIKYYTVNNTSDAEIKFKFSGDKLRVIGNRHIAHTGEIQVTIDGTTYEYSQYIDSSQEQYKRVLFEITNLSNEEHTVTIRKNTAVWVHIDAVDIDSKGNITPIDIESPILEGAVTEEGHALTWGAIEGAKGYNVKRALNAGGPYETIASNITTNSFLDKSIEKETKYFYVVTTVTNEGESKVSNEVTLMSEENSNVTLTLHLSNNHIKEYDITKAEFEKFLDWFDKRMNGEGKAYYVFEKKVDGKPYHTIKEYIVYDQIVWFEVKEY